MSLPNGEHEASLHHTPRVGGIIDVWTYTCDCGAEFKADDAHEGLDLLLVHLRMWH